MMEMVRYPIGKYNPPAKITEDHMQGWFHQIESLPTLIKNTVEKLTPEQFHYSYRKGGWNIHELIYHLTDSHSHSYIRYKWTLTEESPVIKAYNEKSWAKTKDVYNCSFGELLDELQTIQQRIVRVASSLSVDDRKRVYIHPESNRSITLEMQTGMYAWHGMHHLEHIKLAIKNPVESYVPIDCGFYDELVLHAIKKNKLQINKRGHNLDQTVVIRDLTTKDKEEFVHFDNGDVLRLDQIIDIDSEVIYLK